MPGAPRQLQRDRAVPLSGLAQPPGDAHHLPAIDLHGAEGDRASAGLKADVVVRESNLRRALEPPAGHADRGRHRVELVVRVGDHVAHNHAPILRPGVVNVDGQDASLPAQPNPKTGP